MLQVREVCQDVCTNDKNFTSNAMTALQEAAEVYVTETFHKANMARLHAGRETVNIKVGTCCSAIMSVHTMDRSGFMNQVDLDIIT